MTQYNITLRETIDREMVIEAPSLLDAELTAYSHYFGKSNQRQNQSIQSLITKRSGHVFPTPERVSEGSIHCGAVD